ncbi:MAG: DUF1800 domain-containing protein [Pseudomonadota bacterium]
MTVSASTIAAIRFGYGYHPDQPPPRGADDLLTQIRRGTRARPIFPVEPIAKRADEVRRMFAIRKASGRSDEFRQMRRKIRHKTVREGVDGLLHRALSPNGMFERLTAFWLDHFSVGFRNAVHTRTLVPFEHDAIRAHLNGRFADMLTAVAQHPAMLVFLDQGASIGPNSRAGSRRGRGLNENLAREILELHTMGVDGPYTQKDVREFAELLTGYGVKLRDGAFQFFPTRAEPGAETVLGTTYGGDPPRAEHAHALFEDLAMHSATADHIAHKLAVHFVADDPDPDLVRHIAAAWKRSRGNLPRVYEALLDHPAAWDAFGAKVKRPEELIVSTLRAGGLTRAEAKAIDRRPRSHIIRDLKRMNQPLHQPPGPQGWPEDAEAWITPQGLAARLDFAGTTGQRLAKARQDLDPRRFAQTALQDALRPETAFAVGGAPERWEGLALVLASPEFNRR